MIFKKIRRRFMKPCYKCAWYEYRPAILSLGLSARFLCHCPEVLDLYSKKDGKEYYSVSCDVCRGTWKCRFKKKEDEDD